VKSLDADIKRLLRAAEDLSDEYCAAHKNLLDQVSARAYIAPVAAVQQNIPTGLRNTRAASQGRIDERQGEGNGDGDGS
jgi:hypothetical protein